MIIREENMDHMKILLKHLNKNSKHPKKILKVMPIK